MDSDRLQWKCKNEEDYEANGLRSHGVDSHCIHYQRVALLMIHLIDETERIIQHVECIIEVWQFLRGLTSALMNILNRSNGLR